MINTIKGARIGECPCLLSLKYPLSLVEEYGHRCPILVHLCHAFLYKKLCNCFWVQGSEVQGGELCWGLAEKGF
jgi:hypothetical protein